MASLFSKDIMTLQGVGEKRAKLFQKLGAPTVGALLRYYPRGYEDWSRYTSIAAAPLGELCTIRGTVLHRPTETRIRNGMTLYKTIVTDGDSDLHLTFFNNRYIPNLLTEGTAYLFYGKVSGMGSRREMSSPEFCRAEGAPPIVPIYRQTEGLSSRQISNAMKQAFSLLPEILQDPIPDDLRQAQGLCHLRYALENIHFPKTMESLAIARRRLIFEELLVLQLGLLQLKKRSKTAVSCHAITDYSEEFWKLLPFTPTNAQRRAVSEALHDMSGTAPYPMNRLVQGDVGSGKTAVAAALCHSVIKSGKQAALMAPTEILAKQHFASLSNFLAPAGIRLGLLTGSVTAAKKRALLEHLETGEIDLLIGTHALISDNVRFHDLALVITDEQHRFGVDQRASLSAKGENPHLLVMSATPIPRTLALMIYGDLDISVLNERPPGRQEIETYTIDSKKRPRAFQYLRKHIEAGYQCYIICPLIEEGQGDMASVLQYTEILKRDYFPDLEIGILHGKLKAKEKEEVMARFAAGELPILVSTTVVEVGVDVPNAVVILIENAERYGLSQLHQLRGRVGRGTVKSTCILVSDAQNEEAITRLKTMCRTSDGFQIADADLRLRGPGDFFGTNQHGLPDLKIADMAEDLETLQQAQAAAKASLHADPGLSEPNHRGLRGEVRMLFAKVGTNGFN